MPPWPYDEMARDDASKKLQRSSLQCIIDHIIHWDLVDNFCRVMSRYRVVTMEVYSITHDPNLVGIWVTLPHDKTLLICHVVSVVNLLKRLRDYRHHQPPPLHPPSPLPPPPWLDQLSPTLVVDRLTVFSSFINWYACGTVTCCYACRISVVCCWVMRDWYKNNYCELLQDYFLVLISIDLMSFFLSMVD